MIRRWLRAWLGITAIEEQLARDTAAVKLFAEAVTAKVLTRPAPEAQDSHRKPLSGAQLRIAAARQNITVPMPTQAERLANG